MSLRAFIVTTSVLVPAAWHGTDATIETDGKRVRPLQREVIVDGARVTVDVDHNLVTTGDPVTVKLRAFSATPKRVAVDLTVLQSDDSFGSRVASPPRAVDKEHFTLEATPDGGKVIDTKIAMKPNEGVDKIDWFRIYVAAKGTKIDSYGGEGNEDVASIPVLGWSANDFDISIDPKGKLTTGETFDVAVHVRNTTQDATKHRPFVHLGTAVGLYGIESGEDFDIDEADDAGDDHWNKPWKTGMSYTAHFKVTPRRPDLKRVTFIASAFTWDDEPGPISAGAMDAETFKLKPGPADAPHEVAEK